MKQEEVAVMLSCQKSEPIRSGGGQGLRLMEGQYPGPFGGQWHAAFETQLRWLVYHDRGIVKRYVCGSACDFELSRDWCLGTRVEASAGGHSAKTLRRSSCASSRPTDDPNDGWDRHGRVRGLDGSDASRAAWMRTCGSDSGACGVRLGARSAS